MKKYLRLYIIILLFILWINNVSSYWCSEFWFYAKSNFDWTCSCFSWYHFEKWIFWDTTCVKNPSCTDTYWYNARDNFDWTCSCRSWYYFADKLYWTWQECKSLDSACTDTYWYNSSYNILSDKCECSSWYSFFKNSYWWWLECKSCYSQYWLYSEYDSYTKSCWCKDWYILKEWKCEEKNNSAYFYLLEYDDDNNKAIVYSWYSKKYYLLELRYTIQLYKAESFIWKNIVINMWTDFSIDRYDKFILNNETKTTDIVSDILSVEEVDSDYTLKTCEDIYWINSVENYNDKCTCKYWYIWNYNNTECIEEEIEEDNYIDISKIDNYPSVVKYESNDFYIGANYLADLWIINKKNIESDYNLDDFVLRQEISAVALWVAWLKKKTICDNLFSDVKIDNSNNWACYSIESLAESNIIAINDKFFPKANITKAEAVWMMIKARFWENYKYDIYNSDSWQKQVVDFAVWKWIVTNFYDYNSYATRWFVFNIWMNCLKNIN